MSAREKILAYIRSLRLSEKLILAYYVSFFLWEIIYTLTMKNR